MGPDLPEVHHVIRSNRRTFGLEIKPDGRLIVRAPHRATQADIRSVISSKSSWIAKTRSRLAKLHPARKPKAFVPGETFWYLGEPYPLELTDRQRPLLELDSAFLLSKAAQAQALDVFIAWYREETRAITTQLIDVYAQQVGFKVNQVRVTSAKTRWGSCSAKNNLNFTYRLCMAPLNIVEYVVVHELVHINIRNHSQAFWDAVTAIKPGYLHDRAWLKEHGHMLTLA